MESKNILKFNLNPEVEPFKESKKARKPGTSRMESMIMYPYNCQVDKEYNIIKTLDN